MDINFIKPVPNHEDRIFNPTESLKILISSFLMERIKYFYQYSPEAEIKKLPVKMDRQLLIRTIQSNLFRHLTDNNVPSLEK